MHLMLPNQTRPYRKVLPYILRISMIFKATATYREILEKSVGYVVSNVHNAHMWQTAS